MRQTGQPKFYAMKSAPPLLRATFPRLHPGLLMSAILCLFMLLWWQPAQAADDIELSEEDVACQTCHDGKDHLVKKTEAGETVSLMISTKDFLASMHNETSCTDCHEDIDEKNHGKVEVPMESKRAYRMSYQDSCTTCHKKNVAKYKDSVHAMLVSDGSDKAPTCSDCHNSHTQLSIKVVEPIANVPCANCHKKIFEAYAQDVHGLERVAKGKSAPICADCHQSHAIQAASLGSALKDSCLTCHKDAAAKHEDWLPNSGRHFESISCPVCHAPDAQRRVNLRMVDAVGGAQLLEKKGVPQFERLTQAADDGNTSLNERELRSFLKEFNLENVDNKAILNGRLEVRSGVSAHQLAEKEKALKDCKICHQAGATPFQSVVLTMAGPDGRAMRHGVEKEVLNSLTAMGTMRGFYAIGSTRIKMLDYLLVLVVLGVLCVPIAHLTANQLFKGRREKLKAQRQAAQSAAEK